MKPYEIHETRMAASAARFIAHSSLGDQADQVAEELRRVRGTWKIAKYDGVFRMLLGLGMQHEANMF